MIAISRRVCDDEEVVGAIVNETVVAPESPTHWAGESESRGEVVCTAR